MLDSLHRQARAQLERSRAGLPGSLDEAAIAERRAQWLDMLGIGRDRRACPLDVRVSGVVDGDGFTVENLAFQPVAGQYIPANLWLPFPLPPEPAPCVVYLCGHSPTAKWHYQSHPHWLATHGYVCLIVDTLETNESQGDHHGVYSKRQWHWISQGYTPAGVEVEIARRALDYLATRPEADATRCGLTGISGGATMSLYAAAADERFAAAAPHCIAGTLAQNIVQRGIDGHCDCAFWVNSLGWELHDVAALVAPRPLLFSLSTGDMLCRPEPIRELVDDLRPRWAALGAEDALGLSEDDAPHAYTPRICQRIFSWFDRHLAGGAGEVPIEDNIGFTGPHTVDESGFLPPDHLVAYTADFPPSARRMQTVDRGFIPLPRPLAVPSSAAAWERVAGERLARLRESTFRQLSSGKPAAAWRELGRWTTGFSCAEAAWEAEPELSLRLQVAWPETGALELLVLAPCQPESHVATGVSGAGHEALPGGVGRAVAYVRGTGDTSPGPGLEWTLRRMYALLGQSLPERQTGDLLQAAAICREHFRPPRLALYGKGTMAAAAIYAAVLGDADELILEAPVTTHWQAGPEFPGVLKVGDLPEQLALFAPRRITFVGAMPSAFEIVAKVYAACGHADRIRVVAGLGDVG